MSPKEALWRKQTFPGRVRKDHRRECLSDHQPQQSRKAILVRAQHMPKKGRTEEPGMFDKEFSMAGPQVQNAGRCVRKKEGADRLEEGRARL